MIKSRKRIEYILTSFVIIFILSAQFLAGTLSHRPLAWPILSYPMYSTAKYEGDRLLHDYDIIAVLEGGDQFKVRREDLGMLYWQFHYTVYKAIRQENTELLGFLIEDLCDQNNKEVNRLEIRDLGVMITKEGPVGGQEPMTLGSVDVSC